MRYVAGSVLILVALASGCSHAARSASGPVPGAHVRAVHRADGDVTTVYAVGPDIAAGVWTTTARPCIGVAARSATFDVTASGGPDDFLRASARVGDVQRIVLRKGEYFDVDCGPWVREDGTGPATPDPATRAGACTILIGPDHLVTASLKVTDSSVTAVAPVDGYQDKLMAVVYSRTKGLWRPAGQLVDYLDDPAGYYEHGRLISKVSRAVARIHAVCGR